MKRDPNDLSRCECGHSLWYCPNCEQPTGKCPYHDVAWIVKHLALERRRRR